MASDLLEAMLAAGWVEVDERREPGRRWVTAQVSIIDVESCREALGLVNRDRLDAEWQRARSAVPGRSELAGLAAGLDALAPAFALRRLRWLHALDRWCAQERTGTRRDFAYFASGLTKGIPDSDWNWLAESLDLNALGVDPHTPLLLVHGPIRLKFGAAWMHLDAAPDFMGLTLSTLATSEMAEAAVERYRVIENRTTFEHACRAARAQEAVIWVPGHPPRWWRDALMLLLRLCPAPVVIEADPDPSGIAIACEVGAVCTDNALSWSTHNMDAAVLDALPRLQSLSDADRRLLESLLADPLPPGLRELALAMQRRGVKGEQEGLRIGQRASSAPSDTR